MKKNDQKPQNISKERVLFHAASTLYQVYREAGLSTDDLFHDFVLAIVKIENSEDNSQTKNKGLSHE